MTGKNCPFCGAEIEPGKAREKAVCPSCGREFDYNTLNAEARDELARKERRFNALSAEIKIARALNRLKARDHVN